MNNFFSKVVRVNSWVTEDTLDGIAIKDREILSIRWPNGNETIEVVTVKSETVRDTSHGGGTLPVDTAYIVMSINGLDVFIPLAGLEAHR